MEVKAVRRRKLRATRLQGRNKVKTVIHLICVLMSNICFSLVSVSLVMMVSLLLASLFLFQRDSGFETAFLCADAPHLSLLIKNKAKSVLDLTLTAPSFVRLETNKVRLLESQDTKVITSLLYMYGLALKPWTVKPIATSYILLFMAGESLY